MSEQMEPRVTLLLAVIDSLRNNPEYEARAYVGFYEEKPDDLEWFQELILLSVGPEIQVIPEARDHGTVYRFVRDADA